MPRSILPSRTPPKAVRDALAAEVGFGCPAPNCGSPYLVWHHFDPPWNERNHHEPGGMIALCREHHDAADAGAYTTEDFRAMKAEGRDRAEALSGSFEWRRKRLIAVIGGCFYYENPVAVMVHDRPVVSFNRDTSDRLLLNVAMPSTAREPRLRIEDNYWIEAGAAEKVECPPNGRLVAARYSNGDQIRIEFCDVRDGDHLSARYTHTGVVRPFLESDQEGFPVTAVEIRMRLMAPNGEPLIDFTAQETKFSGGGGMKGSFAHHNYAGLAIM